MWPKATAIFQPVQPEHSQGQNIRFRFRIGADSTINDYGWFIDDVRIYTCDTSTLNLKTYLLFLSALR